MEEPIYSRLTKTTDPLFTHSLQEQPPLTLIGTTRMTFWPTPCDCFSVKLDRNRHIRYCLEGLEHLERGYSSLDASRTWLCFWILHSLELLNASPSRDVLDRVADFLSRCQHEDGGFGGGPGQLPHLAATYAAVSALAICGTKKARQTINRESLYKFILARKQPNGSFQMHDNGEADVRGAYCALAVASLCGLLSPELTHNTAQWIASCQTWEGGIAGEPFNEAHGGYAFCGYAGLVILQATHLIDKAAFLWLVFKQQRVEGGFQGRANKLVDGCYSYWQGASFPLLDSTLLHSFNYQTQSPDEVPPDAKDQFGQAGGWCFNQLALQQYLLGACQNDYGGLIDKPGKGRDFYHTCYGLSGLATAQHNPFYDSKPFTVFGDAANLLEANQPIYNITAAKVLKFTKHFPPTK